MSATHQAILLCDHVTCDATYTLPRDEWRGHWSSIAKARDHARHNGWAVGVPHMSASGTYRYSDDYCPTHFPRLNRPNPKTGDEDA